MEPFKTRRGVYTDLSLSPYSVTTGCGNIFKFSSKKKMEIFQRICPERLEKLEKNFNKIHKITGYKFLITDGVISDLEHKVYKEVEY